MTVNGHNLIRLCSLFIAIVLINNNSSQVIAQNSKSKTTSPAPKAVDKKETNNASKATPEPVIENVLSVSTDQLVNKPQDFVGKNVKFNAKFSNFSSLALDYKPAFRSSKTYLSFLVFRSSAQIPLSELKLAMVIPKEKDSDTKLLTELKEGDQLEIVGKVFSAALDDPWLDVLKLKKIGGSQDEKKTVANNNEKGTAATKETAKEDQGKKESK